MRLITAVALALLLTIPILLTAESSTQTPTIYYFDAIGGYYYIVVGNYDAFYVDSNGNRYWIQTYSWDIDSLYTILQSPISGAVYLIPSVATKPILSTKPWFKANVELNFNPTITLTISFPSPWSRTDTYTHSPSIIVSSTYTYNGSIVLTNTTTLAYPSISSASFGASTSSTVSLSTDYRATITVSGGSGRVRFDARACASVYFPSSGTSMQHKWVVSATQAVDVSYIDALGFNASTTVTIRTKTSTESISPTSFYNNYNIVLSASAQNDVHTRTVKFSPDSLGRIVASNGNVIVDVTSKLQQASFTLIRADYVSLALYATSARVTLSNRTVNGFAVVFSSLGFARRLATINPVAYVRELNKFYPLAIHGFNTSKTIVSIPATLDQGTYTLDIIWNYPFMMGAWANMTVSTYDTPSKLVAVLGVSGIVNANDMYRPYHINVSGYVYFSLLSNQLAEISYTLQDGYENVTRVTIGNHTFIMARVGEHIYGNVTIYSATVYNTVYPIDRVNVTIVLVSELTLNTYPIYVISLGMGIGRGLWAYKIPVYISLSEIPQAPVTVFRLRLPLGIWVKQGLVSPSLEDLAIVSSDGDVLPFTVLYWESSDYAIAFVRYNKPLTTTTLTLYVYLKNTHLWGTGNTFQTLSTFDMITPTPPVSFKDHVWNFTTVSTHGVFNYFVFTSWRRVLLGTTPFDGIILDPANGKIIEYHGTFTKAYDVPPTIAARELALIVRGSKIDVYADGAPAMSIDISALFPSNVATAVQFIGWEGTQVYISTTTYYTYSVGGIIGGVHQAPPVQVSQQQQVAVVATDPWAMVWQLAPFILIVVVMAVVVRLVRGGSLPAGGGRSGGVALP